MNEDEGELDKFLYGDEYSNMETKKVEQAEDEIEEIEDEEEEEDDYEIILDSSKLTSNNLAASSDLNKRSLTSVAIGDGKGEEDSGTGVSGQTTANPSATSTAAVTHFDPFAPANLNGTQLFDHDLENFEDKPWRKPGADLTDYFNFGFNEVTWRAYCVKQKALREEFGLQKKIGVYDSSTGNTGGTGGGAGGFNGSNTSLNMRPPREFINRRPPPPPPQGDQRGAYGYPPQQPPQQQQDPRAYGHYHQQQQHQQDSYGQEHRVHQAHSHQPRDYNREYSRPRLRHNSPSPPPPPPPPSSSSRHVSSRDRSRSRSRSPDSSSRRYVSRSSRYDETPRSPPSKRRRD